MRITCAGLLRCHKAIEMDNHTPCTWQRWVRAALVHDLSVHLVGAPDAIARAEKVARDVGNAGFLWSSQHYTPCAPPEAAQALEHAHAALFSSDEIQTLVAHTSGRPKINKRTKTTLYTEDGTTPLLQNIDAPAALATWNLLHPGATTSEIQCEILVCDIDNADQIFAADNPWIVSRVKALQRAARGLAVRKRAKGRKSTQTKVPAV